MKNRELIKKLLDDLNVIEHSIFNLLSSEKEDIFKIQKKTGERGTIISILEKYSAEIATCRETSKKLQVFIKNNMIIEKRLEEKREQLKKEIINTKKAHLIHKSYGQQNGHR